MAKKDFSNTSLNPFAVGKAAAAEVLGLTEKAEFAAAETKDETISAETAPEIMEKTPAKKKSREARDKENGKQSLHVILPAAQVEAIKMLASNTGLSTTQFVQRMIQTHMDSDWKPIIDQFMMTQKKLGFANKSYSNDKNIFGL